MNQSQRIFLNAKAKEILLEIDQPKKSLLELLTKLQNIEAVNTAKKLEQLIIELDQLQHIDPREEEAL